MELSMGDRDRISVLRQVSEGVLSAADGAVRFGVTERRFRRVRRRFEAEGDVVVVHGLRGLRSNRSLPSETRKRVLAMARDPDYAGFGPTLLGEHAERVLGARVSAETVRGWLVAEGLWARKRRRAKHRSRRGSRRRPWAFLIRPTTDGRCGGSWGGPPTVVRRTGGAACVGRTIEGTLATANFEPGTTARRAPGHVVGPR